MSNQFNQHDEITEGETELLSKKLLAKFSKVTSNEPAQNFASTSGNKAKFGWLGAVAAVGIAALAFNMTTGVAPTTWAADPTDLTAAEIKTISALCVETIAGPAMPGTEGAVGVEQPGVKVVPDSQDPNQNAVVGKMEESSIPGASTLPPLFAFDFRDGNGFAMYVDEASGASVTCSIESDGESFKTTGFTSSQALGSNKLVVASMLVKGKEFTSAIGTLVDGATHVELRAKGFETGHASVFGKNWAIFWPGFENASLVQLDDAGKILDETKL